MSFNSTSSSISGDRRSHKLFNPYTTLSTQGILPIHRLIYELPTSPEHLFHEESISRHRSWSHDLSFCYGVSFLSGSVVGGGIGYVSGVRAGEKGESLKLRTNHVLNTGGSQGWKAGNSAGVMGPMFSVMKSGIMHVTGKEGWSSTVGTGSYYRASKAVRSAAIAGVVGVAGKNVIKRYAKNVIKRYAKDVIKRYAKNVIKRCAKNVIKRYVPIKLD